MEFSHFSGVFGVYDRTEPLVTGSAGLADRNWSVPNDPAYSYQTASGTKGFTAAAVLALAAEGKLRPDDSVKSILLGSSNPRKYGDLSWLSDSVTVRSLLDHTSGVPDYFDEDVTESFEDALNGEANYHFEKPEQFFPLTATAWRKQETPYASRGTFRYSNGGFVLLAAAAEAASGKPFPDLVSRLVFRPAGMKRSGFFRLDAQPPDGIVRAAAYMENGRSNIYAVPVIGGGDGGAYTNPADMARFWHYLDPDNHPGSPWESLIRESWTPVQDGGENLYGLGFWISRRDPGIVFLEGFDPGVQFFSFYNRRTKRSLTICLNDEAANCDEVFQQYYAMVE